MTTHTAQTATINPERTTRMKTLLGLCLALCIAVPAGLGQDASALSITPVEGGALAGVDVLAASDAVASDGWTGIHPVVFLRRNWKGILAASGTALAAYAAYEVYDHQHDSKKSKSAEDEEEEDPTLDIPDITGGVVVTAVEGDGNTITTYFYSPQN